MSGTIKKNMPTDLSLRSRITSLTLRKSLRNRNLLFSSQQEQVKRMIFRAELPIASQTFWLMSWTSTRFETRQTINKKKLAKKIGRPYVLFVRYPFS